MSKIANYLAQLVLDDSFRYPGVVVRNSTCQTMLDPMLWPHGALYPNTPGETYSLNLKKL